jgi:Acetyltransferase (GNAT) domain
VRGRRAICRWRRVWGREKTRAMSEVEPVVDELAGRLVRLRGLEPADVDVIREGDRDSEGVRRAGATHLPYPAFAQRKWWEEDLAKRVEDDSAHLAIETLDGMFVGSIGVGRPDRRNGVFGYGIGILAPHRGKGYGTGDPVVAGSTSRNLAIRSATRSSTRSTTLRYGSMSVWGFRSRVAAGAVSSLRAPTTTSYW